MAGFLTCPGSGAFPSFDSDMLPFPFAELTAAGTVQDFHLFPSQGFTTETLHHFAAAKIHFFSDILDWHSAYHIFCTFAAGFGFSPISRESCVNQGLGP